MPPPVESDRTARENHLRQKAIEIYNRVTESQRQFVRVDELCRRAAAAFPDLLPSDAALAEEAPRLQKDKRGLEIDQGLFLSAVLADPAAGGHLCHAMLLPHPHSQARLAEFERRGSLDLGGARVHREGSAVIVTMTNPRFLNAEDESTLEPLEVAIDIATLDRQSEICVLRGGEVTHTRHAGKRLFGAGINLTHLYQGKIRYLWYIVRDLGLVNKLYRGLAKPDASPEIDSIEKLWIGAIEGFAIGGHCQTVLTLDYVLAMRDAYMTLPARKEGIIPGAANLRLTRFIGARMARQAVLAERRIDCASPEGLMIVDELVDDMDAAIKSTVEKLTGSGVVSAAGNRRAFRISEEPLDSFRRYMSVYAREQAQCHFSPALIANLERNWNAASRRA